MKSKCFKIVCLFNALVAVILIFTFEPLHESVEVANAGIGRILDGASQQQIQHAEQVLGDIQTKSSHVRVWIRILSGLLIINTFGLWIFSERSRSKLGSHLTI